MFLMKPLSFLAVLFGAYVLKRVGVLHREDGAAVSRLVMTLTLPAAVVQSFAGFSGDASLAAPLSCSAFCAVLRWCCRRTPSRAEWKNTAARFTC